MLTAFLANQPETKYRDFGRSKSFQVVPQASQAKFSKKGKRLSHERLIRLIRFTSLIYVVRRPYNTLSSNRPNNSDGKASPKQAINGRERQKLQRTLKV